MDIQLYLLENIIQKLLQVLSIIIHKIPIFDLKFLAYKLAT